MSDNRKYYYLKLKENYFDDDSIVLLESMQDGVLYSNILLKLYLKSLKHGGRLQLDEDIPYTAQMIATITRQQIGTVERALQIFLKLGLVEVLDSGTFYMSNPESLAFVKATESTGLQLGLDSYRAPWKIICIRTAFKEYKAYGADLYKEALTMLAKGWEGDPDSLRSGILQGMVRFVALYQGEYDPDRLVKRLHTVHPMTLVNDEKSLSGTVSYKYMMLILRTYNGASRRFNLPIKQ